ncbi:hypothetical protein F4775DRAFT_588679 [Biscogniauxia sp. FL1348]|nr:hypothetical protein F4775DRAFT_588679 [Biscogniauxia sp. FL1348]
MANRYRVYVRFHGHYCIRFHALGDGILGRDGLDIFEWVRNPRNIDRLRKRCIHTYEIDDHELPTLLARKILENKYYAAWQMDKYESGDQMLKAFEKDRAQFAGLKTGVEKLDAIASSENIMTIPRTGPRTASDPPEWLYLLDVDKETLEVYDFKDLGNSEPRKTMNSLVQHNVIDPPGYYIKLELSELHAMWRNDWITRHQTHANTLRELWMNNRANLRSVRRVCDLPFSVLYASVFYGKTSDSKVKRRSTRLTRAKLAEAVKMVWHARESSILYSQQGRPTEMEKEKHLKYFHWAWNLCQSNPRGIRKR